MLFRTIIARRPIMRRIALFLVLALSTLAAVADPDLFDREQRDWSQVGELARDRRLPVVVLVSSEDCGYCRRLKDEILLPMQRDGSLADQAVLGELGMYSGGKLVDFDGERVRTRIFLDRYQIYAYPTLLFLDDRGRPIHGALVGYNGRERYQPLLLDALSQSRAALTPPAHIGSTGVAAKGDADVGG